MWTVEQLGNVKGEWTPSPQDTLPSLGIRARLGTCLQESERGAGLKESMVLMVVVVMMILYRGSPKSLSRRVLEVLLPTACVDWSQPCNSWWEREVSPLLLTTLPASLFLSLAVRI